MKKIITFLLISLIKLSIFAQIDSNSNNKQQPDFNTIKQILDYNINSNKPENLETYVLNIKFIVVKNTDGSGPTQNLGEAEMMNAMKILNTTFNSSKIYFKYRGFDVIKNTTYMKIRTNSSFTGDHCINSQPNLSNLFSYSQTISNPISFFNINVYIVEKINEHDTTFISQEVGTSQIGGSFTAITYNYFLSNILVREIGHDLGLYNINNLTVPTCEFVDGSNSNIAGDYISDTPATSPYFFSINNMSSNCTYVSTGSQDCSLPSPGAIYVNVPINNFMIPFVNNCNVLAANFEPGLGNFTNGQKNKMRTNLGDAIFCTNWLSYVKTNIETLYEPFSVTTLPNGTKQHKFQKGFTYTFYDSVAPNPLTASTSITPLISNISTDYRVRIQQVDTSLYANDFKWVLASTPNTFLLSTNSGEYSCGKIISSSQLGGYPFTTKILNSYEVNDPNLKENLQEKQYHIVTKEDAMGSKIKEVIYKN